MHFPVQNIRGILSNDKTREEDMLRLVLLYALRYEKHSNNDISGLMQALERRGVSDKYRKVSKHGIYPTCIHVTRPMWVGIL